MIKHIVMYKLKDYSPENAAKLRDTFLSMKGKIPQLQSLESGLDFVRAERSFDVVLVTTFLNREDMQGYLAHPVHLPVKAYVHEVTVASKSVDFEE